MSQLDEQPADEELEQTDGDDVPDEDGGADDEMPEGLVPSQPGGGEG